MKKITSILTAAALALTLAACAQAGSAAASSQAEAAQSRADSVSVSVNPDSAFAGIDISEATSAVSDASSTSEGGHSILIAYFTWAENTHVENPEAVDVDATTSASVLLPGNAAKMANWIQQEVGGDLFSIVVTEPYSSDYDECLERAAEEKAADARPALVNHVENMDEYDVVFLGFPNWWYTVPMAIHTFLEEYDFSGKTVIPFVTHGTGGLASTIQDITADLPSDVTLLDPIGVYRPEVDASESRVKEWAASLNLDA